MKILVGAIFVAFCSQPVLALDFGADTPIIPSQVNLGPGFVAGLAEQVTYFNNTQFNGRPPRGPGNVPIPFDQQYLTSVTSEPFLGYNFSDRVGVRLELPVIYRQYQRILPGNAITVFLRSPGSLWGLGDIRLLGNVGLIKNNTPDCDVNWNFTAGVKFPTGNPDQLALTPQQIVLSSSGITGSDLALGSGSYDGVIGTDIFLRHTRLFFSAETQYAIRSEGAFTYQYANDLSWSGGPGVYWIMKEDETLSFQAVVSGDTKGADTQFGILRGGIPGRFSLGNTGETGVYLGPQINFTWHKNVSAQLGADLPVSVVTDGVQIVPTFRVHGAVTVSF
jgi:hypothetical protein